MHKEDRLMVEAYVDGMTHTKNALAAHIMHMANHGIPSREEFIKIRHALHHFSQEIQDRGTAATAQEQQKGRHMIAQLRAYRSSHADDPGSYADDPDGTAAKKATQSEDAEDRSVQPGGSIEDITDAQNKSVHVLKDHGFHVNKVSNAHAEQMGGPVVYMGKKTGAMHQVAEVDPQGMINDESPEDYLANHVHAEDAEDAVTPKQSYNAMTHLTQAANHIRHILQTNADDEAQVEHIIRMAQIILGPKSDHTDAEYRKMLDGLIVILNRFIIVPMN
jgi:hypothetical protein